MPELEQELRDLGAQLGYPPTPDLAGAVRRGLAEEPARPRLLARRRRAVVVLLVAVTVAIGIAFAVPPARTAILHFFGFHGVTIERVETLPPAPPPSLANLDLGPRVSYAEAERLTRYRILSPGGERSGAVYFRRRLTGGEVSFVLRCCRHLLLLSEFRGEALPFAQKMLGPGTTIEHLTVGGVPGVWLSGRPHAIVYRGPNGEIYQESLRLAGNTLLWQLHGLTLRLEGTNLTRAEALRFAVTVH